MNNHGFKVPLAVVSILCINTSTFAQSADFDNSGAVEFADFIAFASAFGSTDTTYDLSGNGTVDFTDFLIFAQAFGTSNPQLPEPDPTPPPLRPTIFVTTPAFSTHRMRLIPAGEFPYATQWLPLKIVFVDDFYIDINEVTNTQFVGYISGVTGCPTAPTLPN